MSNKIAIIDYGMGNLRSVQKAFEKIGSEVIITNNHDVIKKSDKIVLPGVGAFRDAMKNLCELDLVDLLHREVIIDKKPFLGICLGMQLLAKSSEEFGDTQGLGWINAKVIKLPKSDFKVPHVGWNEMSFQNPTKLFVNIPDNKDFYFVHSYYFDTDEEYCIGKCDYGIDFVCAIQKENIFATQFHPEKSQVYGLEILKNFADLDKSEFC